MSLPHDYSARKALPLYDFLTQYFPDALVELVKVSVEGNKQHNPGEPLHWARGKSTDQLNTAMRHMFDHGGGATYDVDGTMHLAKAAWRLLAEIQLLVEKRQAAAKPSSGGGGGQGGYATLVGSSTCEGSGGGTGTITSGPGYAGVSTKLLAGDCLPEIPAGSPIPFTGRVNNLEMNAAAAATLVVNGACLPEIPARNLSPPPNRHTPRSRFTDNPGVVSSKPIDL